MQLINATEARKNFFSILDEVYFDGKEYVIEKGSRVKVKVSPVVVPKKFDFTKYRSDIKKMKGVFTEKDFKDIQAARKSMDRDLGDW